MVRHVVIWQLKDEFDEDAKKQIRENMAQRLTALADVIEGIAELRVVTGLLPGSTGDAMLDSLFTGREALDAYQAHPEHLKVREYIHSVVKSRMCIDYTES